MRSPTSPPSAINRCRLLLTQLTIATLLALAYACAPADAATRACPVVTIDGPRPGATVSGSVRFAAAVRGAGARRVSAVRFAVDGQSLGSDPRRPYAVPGGGLIDTTRLTDGAHRLAVTARAGARRCVTRRLVVVANQRMANAVPSAQSNPGDSPLVPDPLVPDPTPIDPLPIDPPPADPGPEPTGPTGTEPPADPPADPAPTGPTGAEPPADPPAEHEPQPTAMPDTATDPTTLATKSWKLVYNDDFNGTALDPTKWNAQRSDWLTGGVPYSNLEGAWYLPGNVSVTGGALGLTLQRQTSNGYPYTTGSINTRGRFSLTYGYVEARIKVPSCSGCWPAFWMLPSDNTWPPEIDIFEFFDTATTKFPYGSYHWSEAGTHKSTTVAYGGGADYTGAWHTYGLLWDAGTIQMFVDGKAGAAYKDSSRIVGKPMYLILQLAIGSGYAPASGSTMLTDYVRAWQLR